MNIYKGHEWQPPQKVELIADIGAIEVGAGSEISTSVKQSIQDGEGKILWLTDETPQDGHGVINGVEFQDVPQWAKGRRDSKQGVFFGRVALGDEIETPVAVKPFLTAVNAGAHEAAMTLHLEGKGLRVYRVLGMSWSPEQGYALLTGFEEESKSLDNAKWSKGLSEPLGRHLTNLEAIEQVGQSLGLMHGNGIVHNDAQVKNFAVNGKEVVLIDLAGARSLIEESGYIDEVGLQAGMHRDLKRFIESLREKNFLYDASLQEWGSFFINVIAPAYRSGLYRAYGEVDASGANLRTAVEQVIQDTFSLFE